VWKGFQPPILFRSFRPGTTLVCRRRGSVSAGGVGLGGRSRRRIILGKRRRCRGNVVRRQRQYAMTPINLSRDQYIADDTANATARNEHALAFHPSMIKLGEELVIVGNPAELLQLKGDPKLLSNRRRHCAPNPDVLHPARLQTRPRLPRRDRHCPKSLR